MGLGWNLGGGLGQPAGQLGVDLLENVTLPLRIGVQTVGKQQAGVEDQLVHEEGEQGHLVTLGQFRVDGLELPDIAGAIDFVLTFQELAAIFQATGIDPSTLPDEENPIASRAGRIYARTGGVSEAVADTLARILPARVGDLQPLKVHGIPNCQRILEQAASGSLDANFVEGMACVGGCVGGPGRVVGADISTQEVNRYGNLATAATPVENPQVYQLLTRLGLEMTSAVMLETSPAAQILSRCIQKPNE